MDACPSCGQEVPDRSVVCGFCGTRLQADAVAPDIRRTVTVFFSDLKGSTSLGEKLDSEALREVLTRYFDAMTAELERYGGTIEKFIGDAIMAVFGLPAAHPDDSLRAVRAAAATKAALANLNEELERVYGVQLTNRTGLATGEVEVGLASLGEHVLTGDVVRLASKLEQSAPPSEILIAGSTYEQVAGDVTARPVEPVTLPGSAAELEAFLLVEASGDPAASGGRATSASADRAADAAARRGLCRVCGEANPAQYAYCASCGSSLETPAGSESRRTVTIVFSDLRASTTAGGSLDPQALRSVMTRAFDVARAALEHHGATVEKFVGDAVMAVFGLPVLHEDDALRAVRAAAAMQVALSRLDEQLRSEGIRLVCKTGVNTGEVVAGNAALAQRLVTGDTVNTAARLEQAAPENAILLGGPTYILVRDAIDATAVEPLALKGKAELVRAFRLLGVRGLTGGSSGQAARRESPLVARNDELRRLASRFHESVVQNGPRLVTVLGDAGVGKSRLVRELERYVGTMGLVLHGRCLSYGDGITFWPITEIVRAAASIQDEDSPAEAQTKLLDLLGERDVVERVASILGLTALTFPMTELFWAVRRFCEILAVRRPLVLVVDSVHWASPSFVELVDYLLATASEAPILLVCLAREELLEAHPDWGSGSRGSRVVLAPLDDAAAAAMLDGLLGSGGRIGELRERIIAVAEGNPLFLEQVVSMLIDAGTLRYDDGRWVRADEQATVRVPPTIHALLAARVDQLPRKERAVLEPASVVGHSFAEPAVEAIVDTELQPEVEPALQSLASRRLVRPDAAAPSSEQWFRFQSLLIRDAAYGALLKRARVALHERFVAWADGVNRERGREREFEEISGYHLEQAYRYRRELGALDPAGLAVGREAGRRLSSAGRRAFVRGDMAAAANLLGRSVDVFQERDGERLTLLPELGEAFIELGQFDEAGAVLHDAMATADVLGDASLRTHASLMDLLREYYTADSTGWLDRARRQAEAGVAIFERLDDHVGLTRAWRILFGVHATACAWGAAANAAERIVRHATLANDPRQEARGATGYATAALFGPVPVEEALERCHEVMARVGGDRRSEAMIMLAVAELEAMNGSFDSARQRYEQARSMLLELGASVAAASTSMNSWRVETLAGDYGAAEAQLRRDHDALQGMGERFLLSTISAVLGAVVLARGDVDEAASLAEQARSLADADDISSQALWRSLSARVIARRGAPREAISLAHQALDVLRPADSPTLQADALLDLADVHETLGQPAEACTALLQAVVLCEAKGNVVAAEQIRSRLPAGGGEFALAGQA